jgi:hypothetical protein
MKRYIAAVEGMTKDHENRFLDYIRTNKWGWWHRVANVWLIIDWSETASAEQIRNFLLSLNINGAVGIVVPVADGNSWSGLGPKTTLKQTFQWVHDHWTPQSSVDS